MDDEPVYITQMVFGTVKLHTWIEPQRRPDGSTVYVGMGSATTYDEHGNFVSRNAGPTGVTMEVK